MFRKFILAGGAFLAIAATPALAQPGPDLDSVFAEADANHDGLVTRAEFQAVAMERFRRFDRNGDGFLSEDDLPERLRALRPGTPRLKQWLARFDTDGDGRVSMAEFMGGSMALFDAADANHDGTVDRAEAAVEVARARAATPR